MQTARVGIIGAGQLGRMLALAAYPLGVACRFLDRQADSPGGQIGPIHLAELDDAEALGELARSADVVTFEIENVSVDALRALEASVPVYPQPDAVAAAQDRLGEKQLFQSLGIETAPFVAIDRQEDLNEAADKLGWPIVLKARRLGYDGRGQRIVDDIAGLRTAWSELGEVPAIAEGWVHFDRELSLIGVRNSQQLAFYPLTENRHRDGILVASRAPVDDPALLRRAQDCLSAIMERFDYRGVLTVEFFDTGNGLLANEMAPRVHNSGHWTIEGARASQFENHMRAILDWPLGDTRALAHAGMLNLIGNIPDPREILQHPRAHLHHYGKAPRPGRKLGHCTVIDDDRDALEGTLAQLQSSILGG